MRRVGEEGPLFLARQSFVETADTTKMQDIIPSACHCEHRYVHACRLVDGTSCELKETEQRCRPNLTKHRRITKQADCRCWRKIPSAHSFDLNAAAGNTVVQKPSDKPTDDAKPEACHRSRRSKDESRELEIRCPRGTVHGKRGAHALTHDEERHVVAVTHPQEERAFNHVANHAFAARPTPSR